MLFIAVILAILSAVFIWQGARSSDMNLVKLGVIFLIAAFGVSLITYLALKAF